MANVSGKEDVPKVSFMSWMDECTRTRFERLAELQDGLAELTEERVGEVSMICNHFEARCVARNLVRVVEQRFGCIPVFVDLVREIMRGRHDGSVFGEMVVRECLVNCLSVTTCAFVYACARHEVIAFEDVCQVVVDECEGQKRVPDLLWVWFGKELMTHQGDRCGKFRHMEVDIESVARLRDDPFRDIPLFRAVRDDDCESLQALMLEVDPNADWSLFHQDPILDNLVDLKTCTENQNGCFTLMELAAFFGSLECFKYLMMNGGDLQLAESSVFGTLFSGNLEILHLIAREQTTFKSSFIPAAIRCFRSEIAFWMMEKQQVSLDEIAIVASSSNNLTMFLYCLDQGFDVNATISSVFARSMKAIHWASNNRCLEIVDLLLSYPTIKVSVANYLGWRPIHCAAFCRDIDIVRMLIERGKSKVDYRANTVH